MSRTSVAVVSDIHYASAAEIARAGHEARAVGRGPLRWLVAFYRHYIWLRDPFAHNHLLDYFVARAAEADLVVGNGDYSCDTAFVGCVDDPAFESAQTCLGKLREPFGERFVPVYGDHELGKKSIFGGVGGMRLGSYERAKRDLGLAPFWVRDVGVYRLIGVTSSLVALPVYQPDVLPDELARWEVQRKAHIEEIERAFDELPSDRRVILFCHDPSALPFLRQIPALESKLKQVERTIVGHLHSEGVMALGRSLAGIPHVRFLGTTVGRHTAALRQARHWQPFRVQLCPSLAGIELRLDGGFLWLRLDPAGRKPLEVAVERVPREGLGSGNGNAEVR